MKRLSLFSVLALALSLSLSSFAGSVILNIGDETYLSSCGGTAEVTDDGGQVNIVFRNVRSCSNFDIVAANFDNVDYKNLKLEGTDGDRHASFTIPQRFQELGLNFIDIVLKSNSGAHTDKIRLMFKIIPPSNPENPNPAPAPGRGC